MQATLIIQNFGPVKDIHIEIKKFNILIGPQAAGKSTVSKVLAIIHSFSERMMADPEQSFTQLLSYYRVGNFLKASTYWSFEDELIVFELKDRQVKLSYKKGDIKRIDKPEPYYFPAERVALPMLSESLFEVMLEHSSLPGYFLQFGKDFTVARKQQQLFNLPMLDVEFEYREGKNLVILKDRSPLLLEETSSAIQANLPLLVILQYPVKTAPLFVIEELELHGFPTLQKALLYDVVERMKHPKLEHAYVMLPTHSPYILSAANNLLFADKVGRQNNEAANIIRKDAWISKNDFTAYYISNGNAVSIVNQETGLIDENELDSISEDLAGEFDALMELYKPG